MRKRTEVVNIDSTRVVKNRVPNQKVLRMAAMLGMITEEEYTCLCAIGDSKEVDELAHELATMSLDLLVNVLKRLARHELIEIT